MAQKLSTDANDVLARNGLGSLADTVARIVAVWHRATDADREAGARWYGADAEALLAAMVRSGAPSREHAAAVVSHLSPRTSWARNTLGAMAMVTGGAAAAREAGCMGANVARAAAAMASDAPLDTFGGPKTRRFARNLLGDRDAVTVDVWAARVAMGDAVTDPETVLGRVGVYDAVETAYREAAAVLAVDPTTVQATTWIVARNGRAK